MTFQDQTNFISHELGINDAGEIAHASISSINGISRFTVLDRNPNHTMHVIGNRLQTFYDY